MYFKYGKNNKRFYYKRQNRKNKKYYVNNYLFCILFNYENKHNIFFNNFDRYIQLEKRFNKKVKPFEYDYHKCRRY